MPDKSEKPRREAMATEPEMPECDADYLASYLFEIGPSIAGAMGEGPLTHSEIRAWQNNTGIKLNAWESRMLKRLSHEYLSAAFNAKEPTCPAPWDGTPADQSADFLMAANLKQSMRELVAL